MNHDILFVFLHLEEFTVKKENDFERWKVRGRNESEKVAAISV